MRDYRTKAEKRELDAKAEIYNGRWEEVKATFLERVVGHRRPEMLTSPSRRFLEHYYTFYNGKEGKVEIVVKPATKVGGWDWSATGRIQFVVRRVDRGYRRHTTSFKEREDGRINWDLMRQNLDGHMSIVETFERSKELSEDRRKRRLKLEIEELADIPIPTDLSYERVMEGEREGWYQVKLDAVIHLETLKEICEIGALFR